MPHIPVILHQLTGTVELPEASSGGSLLTEACQCAANSLNAPVEHFSVKSVEFEDGQHLGSNAISGYSVGELAQRKAVVNVTKSQGPAADVMQQLQEHMRALAVAVRTNQERTAASVAGLQESFASLESSHANLQRDHNNLQRDYNNLQRDHSNLKTQAQQAEKTNESRYQRLEQYCQKLQRQKQDEENSNVQLQQRYESLQASHTKVEAQCKSLEKSVSKLLWRCHSIALRVLVDAARQEINGGGLQTRRRSGTTA